MPIAWYICPYKRRNPGQTPPVRYCAMDDFTTLIETDGGRWAESECLGNHAVVKVRAAAATLATINAEPGFTRLPKDALDDPLSSLTNAQKTALRNLITGLGYSLAELQDVFGSDIGQHTVRGVLAFICQRRLKPRYDVATDSIILDGPVQLPRSLESIEADVG